ncbi:hypothetical protein [Amycolatopsis sp. NPDC059657]|uniref:hypothetical protein n=1 Tax=Amycolatopsis sp. NPDC059657 TaxID=3346899 RepID=UPI00366C8047
MVALLMSSREGSRGKPLADHRPIPEGIAWSHALADAACDPAAVRLTADMVSYLDSTCAEGNGGRQPRGLLDRGPVGAMLVGGAAEGLAMSVAFRTVAEFRAGLPEVRGTCQR